MRAFAEIIVTAEINAPIEIIEIVGSRTRPLCARSTPDPHLDSETLSWAGLWRLLTVTDGL